MAKEIAVKKMVVQLGDKDIELSIQDAKKLQAVLNELFEERVKREPYPVPQPYPVPMPEPLPYIPRPWRPWRWPYDRPHWQIRCGDGAADLNLKGTTLTCALNK